jgi:Domain of unknown function (DUF4411)
MYLVDADVFIQATNRHYAFDVVPGFWDWLLVANAEGTLASVEAVEYELRGGGDELARWVMDRDETFFLPPDDEVVASLRVVSEWATNCDRYTPAAVADFLAKADYYLVSHAHAHADVVVTHEVSSNSPNKIKIPDACSDLQVECITPFAMLREAGARFVRA